MAREDTQFKEGHSLATGRPKGSTNKTTQQMREIMAQIHGKYLEQLVTDLDMMPPKARWEILCKLAPFHMATLSKSETTTAHEGGYRIEVVYTNTNQPVVDAPETVAIPNKLVQPDFLWEEVPAIQSGE